MLQPFSTNSRASQSSSSECDGFSQRVPKSSGVVTNPTPKYCCQIRLTITRGVSGLFLSTIHRASPNRLRGASVGNGCNDAGVPGCTNSPGRLQSPRLKTRVCRGVKLDESARVVVP